MGWQPHILWFGSRGPLSWEAPCPGKWPERENTRKRREGPWNPGALEPWNPGTLEPWDLGKLEPWDLGTLEPWNLGALGPWDPGTLEPWNPGTLGPWGPWDPGTLEPMYIHTYIPGIFITVSAREARRNRDKRMNVCRS